MTKMKNPRPKFSFSLGTIPIYFAILFSAVALASEKKEIFPFSAELFRIACKDPKKFENQISPVSIKIDCDFRILSMQERTGSKLQQPISSVLLTSITSDSYSAPISRREEHFLPSENIKEWKKKFDFFEGRASFSEDLNCAGLLAYETELDLCKSKIAELLKSNPDYLLKKKIN